MSSGKPIVRQVAWLSLVPQLLLMGVLCLIYRACFDSTLLAVELVMITYLLLSLTLRNCIPRNHRKGIALYKAGKYAQAIEEFKKSDSFFAEHAWIDKYRFLTLLSSSKSSYREMALLNIAFCYSQIGDGTISKEYYLKTLGLFPDSELAKTSLKMMESVQNQLAGGQS